jgi:hypothetical protein
LQPLQSAAANDRPKVGDQHIERARADGDRCACLQQQAFGRL